MAGGDLNQRYTIEKYCTRNDLAKALGTNLVDPFWREITEFRRKYGIELPIYDTNHGRFGLTYIDSVQGKTAQANDRVTSYVSGISKLSTNSVARHSFRRDMIFNSLKAIAKHNNLDVSDVTINNILEKKSVDEQYIVLVRYFSALESLKNNAYDNIDDSFLARHYAILRGEEELTCFYREEDIVTTSSKSLVDKDYDEGIPSHLIDEFMTTLLEFINNFDISLVTRITAIYFMFNYIKPFENYNAELASLLVKRVLASTSIDTACVYVPIEDFVNKNDFFDSINREVKRTRDFTYAFLAGSEYINEAFDIAINKINQVHSSSLDDEVKIGSNEKKIKEEFGEISDKPITKVRPKQTETKDEIQRRYESRAPYIEESRLSEKELKARINDMLEMDPMLKKGQAHFYVHHCTPGRYYTIQQYVKFEGCVYETGRTSMDNLAMLGYYRRDQIKNKFVYTPINKE